MKRREFLKKAAITSAVVAVPSIAFSGNHATVPVKAFTEATAIKSANSFDSNFTKKLTKIFLEKFEAERLISRDIGTQLLQGKPTQNTVTFKRPIDYLG